MIAALLTETLQNHISLLRSLKRIDQRVPSAGEIIVLDINNQQCCFQHYSLSPKISGILAPQFCIPFQHRIITQFVFSQPVLSTVDHDKEGRVLSSMPELGPALSCIYP